MIKHIVCWKFKPGSNALRDRFLAGLQGLKGQIDCLKSLQTGVNINPDETFSATLICEFDSLADLKKYSTDPRHLAVAALIKPICEQRVAVDFEE